MIDDVQVTRDQFILQTRPVGDHDDISLVSHDDASTGKTDSFAEPNVARYSQVIEFSDIRDRLESFFEILSNPLADAQHELQLIGVRFGYVISSKPA